MTEQESTIVTLSKVICDLYREGEALTIENSELKDLIVEYEIAEEDNENSLTRVKDELQEFLLSLDEIEPNLLNCLMDLLDELIPCCDFGAGDSDSTDDDDSQ